MMIPKFLPLKGNTCSVWDLKSVRYLVQFHLDIFSRQLRCKILDWHTNEAIISIQVAAEGYRWILPPQKRQLEKKNNKKKWYLFDITTVILATKTLWSFRWLSSDNSFTQQECCWNQVPLKPISSTELWLISLPKALLPFFSWTCSPWDWEVSMKRGRGLKLYTSPCPLQKKSFFQSLRCSLSLYDNLEG